MNDDDKELVRGSGNVFRDFGYPNSELEQLRAILTARIFGVLDNRKLTVRRAHRRRRRLLPHPPRKPRPLDHRPADDDPRPARPGGGRNRQRQGLGHSRATPMSGGTLRIRLVPHKSQ